MKTAIASTGLILMLTGCAVLGPFEAEEPAPIEQAGAPPRPVSRTEALLRYFEQIRKLPPADVSREHEKVRRAYTQGRTDGNRVRLAMVLSLPGTAVSDEALALDLLQPLTRNTKSDLHGLAVLMATYLQEQRRLGASVQGMQQKLEDLKMLERSLIERERGGARR